jgi:hypothetical protein
MKLCKENLIVSCQSVCKVLNQLIQNSAWYSRALSLAILYFYLKIPMFQMKINSQNIAELP